MRGYGCVRDQDDPRDHLFSPRQVPLIVPLSHDLTPWLPDAMDQGPYGTCTAHGVTAAIRYNLINSDLPDVVLSRSQPYWDAGVLEGNTGDCGRQIRDVIKAVATRGAALESSWGYDRLLQPPPPEVYQDALRHRALEYCRVGTDRASINSTIFLGRPVVIGVPVFAAFESDQVSETGLVPMPRALETKVGMHCMLLAGYAPDHDVVLNSWGSQWGCRDSLGRRGYCKLPRGYLEKHGSDFWTILMDN